MPGEQIQMQVAHPPRNGKKYFTIDQANRALVFVSRVVRDITHVYANIIQLRRELDHPAQDTCTEHLEADYQRAMDRLSDLVDELHLTGVELKDFEIGLVDFPSLFEQREIYLCWQQGETCISHWHEADAGIAGRQGIALLQSAA